MALWMGMATGGGRDREDYAVGSMGAGPVDNGAATKLVASSADLAGIWLAEASTETLGATLAEISDAHHDVVVIGAGLAGLATAMKLHDDGARVVVVDAGMAGGRTTGHSTAKVTALHGLTYAQLERHKGADAAAVYADANMRALAELGSAVAAHGIDCDWTPATAFTCGVSSEGVGAVEAEVEAARRAGLAVELTRDVDLPIPVAAAVALADQAHVDPFALCRGLVRHLREAGVAVLEGVRIDEVDETDRCVVRAGDVELESDFAVLCTHLPIVDPALLAARTRPDRSYAVAGPLRSGGPLSEIPTGMFIAPDAGWSIRPVVGAHGPAVIVGGEGHPMAEGASAAQHYERLATWASDMLGVDVVHRWSAFDYTSVDGLPFIGRLSPRSRRRFVATGFRKWGLTTSMVAGALIADEIAGRVHPAASLFDATRQLPTVGRDLVTNNVRVGVRYVADRFHARSSSPESVAVGEGRVVRSGTSTLAVTRDGSGSLVVLDARCTHLGCIVAFNDAEQTWDCPCHGSRFALDGSVLDGPAHRPLRPVDR